MQATRGVPRRKFLYYGARLAGLGLMAGCSLPRAPWDRTPRMPVIGYLGPGTSGPYPALLEAFRQGLRELGYVEGSSIAIAYRFTDESSELAPGFADELVRLSVDLMVVTGAEAAVAAKSLSTSIPVVGVIL